jgi:dehydrogenase/reductase SDR family protein 7B
MLLLFAARVFRLFLFLYSTGILSVQAFAPVLPTSATFQLSQTCGDSSASTFLKASNQPREDDILPEAATTTTTTTVTMKARTAECFRDKTVLLTGASGGLGRSLALELAACGVGTLVLSARRKDALEEVAAECQRLSANSNSSKLQIHILTCDLGDPASVAELGIQAVKACPKGIDVLINNGGVSSRSPFVETDASVDQKLMQINFLSGAALTKAVAPSMIAKGAGRIVWISSVQGLLAIPGRTSYAASKFAVQGYCDSLRPELAGSGVTVHVISPGYIRTNLSLSAITGDGKAYGKMDETTAKGAAPKDVAVATMDSVGADQAELIVAAGLSAHVGMWLRFLFPGLLRYMLVQRFEKSQAKEKND